jgi:hypothetical protein
MVNSLATGVYSYTMIDGNPNNAVNRALLMALSTLLGASVIDVLQNNDYIDSSGNMPVVAETAVIPLIYFWITNRQFKLPELRSEVLKTGGVAAITGAIATPYVKAYLEDKQK